MDDLLRQDDNNSELQITEKVQIQSHWTIFIFASTCKMPIQLQVLFLHHDCEALPT